ncbi:MAG: uL29 family ribosomal protein [Saprospiraceae bacterium]
MASKRYLELQGLDSDTIKAEASQARVDIHRMKFDHDFKGLENPNEIKLLKKERARLLTELRSREIKEMDANAIAKRSKKRFRRINK